MVMIMSQFPNYIASNGYLKISCERQLLSRLALFFLLVISFFSFTNTGFLNMVYASSHEGEVDPALARFRQSIDNFDAALVHLLAERFRCTQKVGEYKREKNLPPSDPKREAKQIARLRQLADQSGLDPDFAEKFLHFIIEEVIRHHKGERR